MPAPSIGFGPPGLGIFHPDSTAPGVATPWVEDYFGRTLTDAWGIADVGGAWVISGTAADYDVGSGVGTITIAAAATRNARLPAISMLEQDGVIEFEIDKVPIGGSLFLDFVRRSQDTDQLKDSYWLELVTTVTPQFQLIMLRRNGDGTSTTLGSNTFHTLTPTAATRYKVRVQATGTYPTTIRAKLWLASASEPAGWDRSETDSTDRVQRAGAVGLRANVASAVSNGPILFTFDTFTVFENQPVAGGGLVVVSWSDIVTSSDAWTVMGTYGRAWSDATTQADGWARIATLGRSMTESVAQTDAWTRTISFVRSLTSSVTSSDGWTRIATLSRALTEAVTSADVWTRTGTYLRSLAEGVTSSDAWVGLKVVLRSLAEAVTSSDAWTRVGTFARSLASSVASSDAWTRSIGFVRSTAEAVTSSDAWTRAGTFLRSITEAVTGADSWTGIKVTLRSLSESVTQSDAWTRTATLGRSLTEAVTSSDAWTRTGTLLRTLTGAVASADAWVGVKSGAILASWSEAVTSSDAWTRIGTFKRTLTEAVASTDAWAQAKTVVRTLTGSVTSSDAWTRSATFLRSLAEAVTSSDGWTRLGTFRRTLSEAVASADAWIRSVVPYGAPPPEDIRSSVTDAGMSAGFSAAEYRVIAVAPGIDAGLSSSDIHGDVTS